MRNEPIGMALHNIREQPSLHGEIVGTVPSGSYFLGSNEISNSEGIWIELHKQTLHSYDIPSQRPCYLMASLFPSQVFLERLR